MHNKNNIHHPIQIAPGVTTSVQIEFDIEHAIEQGKVKQSNQQSNCLVCKTVFLGRQDKQYY